ncbi:transferrin-binding protein-like solute binding protein [Psychrobacter immobilis]|uniref:transferrin-binding protein-like solute binding protein n=1 Tax=Psychrobacter immobilis TaxID=498 RepID=UPI001D101714|nr:transferrin-binding protein-like solute binding protein [Psychrobacter immobilis]
MSLIHFSKVSALTILAVTIVACSSGGNHTKLSPNTPPLSEQDAAEKAAAEKAAAEKAAAEKAAAKAAAAKAAAEKAAAEKAAAEKAAAEKAAAEKAAAEKAAAEKAAAEKAAAEKAAAEKAAAEKAAAEKAAAEKAAAKAAAAKAAAEKAAAEKAAAEKAAAEKAAAEKAAAAKAAAEKAAAEKAAADKAEKERLQKIEANRLVLLDKAKKAGLSAAQAAAYAEANKQATDKVAQTALENLVADKAAADKAAAEKAAAEKAEKERLQKIEANRLALLDKAKKAGLNDDQATAYAEANKEANATAAQAALETIIAENERTALDDALYQVKGKYHNNSAYPVGQIRAKLTSKRDSTTNGDRTITYDHEVVYNQPYSVVLGQYTSWTKGVGSYVFSSGVNSSITTEGLKTEINAIPSLGTANYSGKAFSSEANIGLASTTGLYKDGLLSYDVNFNNRTGTGSITGLGDTVELQQGTISGTGISAIAQQGYRNGNYLLDFYGKKAEEIAGKVVFDGKDTIGFGGTRGEISK